MNQKFVPVGSYCPNTACPDYGQIGLNHIYKFGRTPRGVQRYRCRTCKKTFTATRGTFFHRKHKQQKDILETLTLLAEGVRMSSIARAKGMCPETVSRWLRQAAKHVEAVEETLLRDYHLTRAQIDGLWTFVGNKGEKGDMQKARTVGSSGGARSSSTTRGCGQPGEWQRRRATAH